MITDGINSDLLFFRSSAKQNLFSRERGRRWGREREKGLHIVVSNHVSNNFLDCTTAMKMFHSPLLYSMHFKYLVMQLGCIRIALRTDIVKVSRVSR